MEKSKNHGGSYFGENDYKQLFSDLQRDLDFVLALPDLKSYFAQEFDSINKSGAKQVLTDFLEGKQSYQMTITNLSGAEMLKVESETLRALSWPNALSNREIHSGLYEKLLPWRKGR